MTTTTPRQPRSRAAAVRARMATGWGRLRAAAGWPRERQPDEWVHAARRRTITTIVSVLVVVAVAVSVAADRHAAAANADAQAEAKAHAPVCTTGHHPIRICVAHTDTVLLPEMDRYAIRLTELDITVGGVPEQFVAASTGISALMAAHPDLTVDTSAWDRAAAIAAWLGHGDMRSCEQLPNSQARARQVADSTLRAWYVYWLYGSRPSTQDRAMSTDGAVNTTLLRQVVDRPLAAQLDWAARTRHALVVTDCP